MTDGSVYEVVITQDPYEDHWERVEIKEIPQDNIEPEHQLDLWMITEEEYAIIDKENNIALEEEMKQAALDRVRFDYIKSTLSKEEIKILRDHRGLL